MEMITVNFRKDRRILINKNFELIKEVHPTLRESILPPVLWKVDINVFVSVGTRVVNSFQNIKFYEGRNNVVK